MQLEAKMGGALPQVCSLYYILLASIQPKSTVFDFLSNNLVSGIIVTVFAAVLAGLRVYRKKNAHIKKKRNTFRREAERVAKSLQEEKVFFDIPGYDSTNPQNFFYNKVSLKNEKDEKVAINDLRNSFIIKGVSGCGKSAIIKYLFLEEYRKRYLNKSNLVLYYDAPGLRSILNDSKDFIDRVKESEYSTMTLYLDGVDETLLPEDREKLNQLFRDIAKHVDNFYPVISCRNDHEHVDEQMLRDNYSCNIFEVEKWTSDQVVEYAESLVSLVSSDKAKNKLLKEFIERDEILKIVEYNPLLIKMLLCIKIIDDGFIPSDNRYEFYYQFLKTLTVNHLASSHEVPVFLHKIHKNAEFFYKAYIKDVRSRVFKATDVPYYDSLYMKKNYQDFVLFKHESFFEFLIGHYIGTQLNSVSTDSIDVLSHEYPNGISDYVSDQLKTNEIDRKSIRNNLLAIYSLTIKDDDVSNYNLMFGQYYPKEFDFQTYKENVVKLDNNHFFTIKYEIIFRIGRLLLEDQVLSSFLQFAYSDENCNVTPMKDTELEKWIVVLKRCCAISASFIGYEDVEIDYIKHMLSYREEYIELYDSINRTHTLLFYGDVKMDNNGILDFLELMDTGEYDCTRSCVKRVNRLSKLKECNVPVKEMSSKDKRIFYFRLFDIATIYSFIQTRKSTKYLNWLNEENKEHIYMFKTDFAGISDQRKVLLEEIKNQTKKQIERLEVR